MSHKNAEFNNEKLAQIYENFNQFSEDEDFWLKIIEDLGVPHITDFGCGTGLFTSILARKGYELIGIEPAKAMLGIAKSKDAGKSIDWKLGSSEMLEGFKTDLVLMTSHVAQFITEPEDWKETLGNSHNILNSGGYILFDTKNPVLKPWENYTPQKYSRTNDTQFGKVNMSISLGDMHGNIITHILHYDFLESGEKLESHNTLIYSTKNEIVTSLESAGFQILKVYGGWNFEEFDENTSDEMIFLAKKV